MDTPTKNLSMTLSNGKVIRVEATIIGERPVASSAFPVSELMSTIESLASELDATLQKIKPKKAAVKFGLEVAFESGKLTALLVKGSTKANLELTLEWGF
jgi:hypothetical protein